MLLSAGKEILIKVVAQAITTTTNKTYGDEHFSSCNTLIFVTKLFLIKKKIIGDEFFFIT